MRQFLKGQNQVDDQGNPTGGYVRGVGINIKWQEGPLGNPPDLSKHNGAFVEGLLEAAYNRLKFFQGSKFKHSSNQEAMELVEKALAALDSRTQERKAAGKEGTHAV